MNTWNENFSKNGGIEEKITLKSLGVFKNILSLYLFYCHFKLNDRFAQNINSFLPQLKRLKIFETILNDNLLKSLANLRNLKMINTCDDKKINESKSLTEKAICYLINNCQNIESISLLEKLLITSVTFDALIALAVRKPKICFKHNFVYPMIWTMKPNNSYMKNV
jgi:hypothetical protein